MFAASTKEILDDDVVELVVEELAKEIELALLLSETEVATVKVD